MRHLDAASNAEVLDNVVDAQVILAFKGFRMRRMPYDGGICAIGDNEPHADNLQRIGERHPEAAPYFGPVQNAVLHVRGMAFKAPAFDYRAKHAKKVQAQNDRKYHHQDNKREQAQQQNAVAVIPPNLCLEPDVFHTGRNFGALRCGHGHPIAMLQGSL